MKRAALSKFLVVGAAALGGTFAVAHPNGAVTAQVAPKKQKVLIGFYKNRTRSRASERVGCRLLRPCVGRLASIAAKSELALAFLPRASPSNHARTATALVADRS